MFNDELKELLLALRRSIEDPGSNYSSRNSSKGALLAEANILFSYLTRNNSLTSARHAVIQDNIFAKKTYQTKKNCWAMLHSRYFPNKKDVWRIHPIISLFQTQAPETMKRWVLYYHFVTSDLFSYEATVELVYDLYCRGITNIAPRDVHEFLDLKAASHPEVNAWSPQTRRSLVNHYLSAIRDFGILEGKVRKRIHRPTIEENLFLYIVTYLRDCGKNPKAILASNDFRLFLLSQGDVEARLIEVYRRGRIRYQNSGRIVSLELPWRSIFEYIKNIG